MKNKRGSFSSLPSCRLTNNYYPLRASQTWARLLDEEESKRDFPHTIQNGRREMPMCACAFARYGDNLLGSSTPVLEKSITAKQLICAPGEGSGIGV